jgi:glutathione S-transferase
MSELRLHDYGASANCLKVRILLAALGLAYTRIPVDIFAGETLTDEFLALNPARTTPVLQFADGGALTESAAILFYLADGTPLLPATALERAQVIRWLVIEQTDVIPTMGGLRFRLATGRLRADEPEAQRRLRLGEEVLAFYDAHLRERDFLLAGRYTIADIASYAYIHVAGEAGLDLGRHPAVLAWLSRIEAQPRFVNDLEPYPPNARVGQGSSIYA